MDKPIKKKLLKASAFDKDTERKLQAELELQGKSPVPFLKELGYAHPPSVATTNKQHPDSIEYRDERLKEIRHTTDEQIRKMLIHTNKQLDACAELMVDPNDSEKFIFREDTAPAFKMANETLKTALPIVRALGDRTGDWKSPEMHPEDVKRKLETQAKALFTEYLNRYVDKDEAMSRFKEDAPTLSPYVM